MIPAPSPFLGPPEDVRRRLELLVAVKGEIDVQHPACREATVEGPQSRFQGRIERIAEDSARNLTEPDADSAPPTRMAVLAAFTTASTPSSRTEP